MANIDDETRFQQWNERISAICNDVQGIITGRFIYRSVHEIIEANASLHEPSAFYGLMASAYSVWAAVGVRRQVDTDADSVSLVNLLEAITQYPEVISRERFVAAYEAGGFRPEVIEQIADEYLGSGATQTDPALVQSDVTRLRDTTKPIKRYVNKRVAHLDRMEFKTVPTFDDLDNALNLLEALTIKYLHLLTGKQPETFVPVFQYDWTKIFREPWIIR